MSLLAVLNPVIEDVSEHIPQEVSMGNCPEKCSALQALTIARKNSPIPLKQCWCSLDLLNKPLC